MAAEEKVAKPAVPPQMVLYQLATGHYISNAIYLAGKLGVADLLKDGPRHFAELAETTGTHASALNRLMRLLSSVGVFEENPDGKFALTAVGECLRANVPGSLRAMAMMHAGGWIQDSWRDLEYCIRTGEPAFRKRGLGDPFVELAKNPEEAANFDAAMAEFTQGVAVAVAAAYNFAPFRTVVDVGGGA